MEDKVRRDAVRENDGPSIVSFWKQDMVKFHNNNHRKYFILGHNLITNLSGCVSERMQQDLVWSRTVNLRGGAGNNDEVDLVNEFLNNEFKENLQSAGHQLSDATLDRHSKLAGGVGHVLDNIYSTTVSELESFQTGKSIFSRRKDIETFVRVLKDEELLREIPGRYHRAYQNFRSEARIKNTDMYISHINKLSRKFDKRNKIIANSYVNL